MTIYCTEMNEWILKGISDVSFYGIVWTIACISLSCLIMLNNIAFIITLLAGHGLINYLCENDILGNSQSLLMKVMSVESVCLKTRVMSPFVREMLCREKIIQKLGNLLYFSWFKKTVLGEYCFIWSMPSASSFVLFTLWPVMQQFISFVIHDKISCCSPTYYIHKTAWPCLWSLFEADTLSKIFF